MAVFCYTVALTAVIKAETLVIRLRAVPNNSTHASLRAVMHSAELRLRAVQYFSDDSAQWCIARSHLYLQIAVRFRNHMQKSFSLLISDPTRIDYWKKPEVENLVRLSL
jgi:hypothetical protein